MYNRPPLASMIHDGIVTKWPVRFMLRVSGFKFLGNLRLALRTLHEARFTNDEQQSSSQQLQQKRSRMMPA